MDKLDKLLFNQMAPTHAKLLCYKPNYKLIVLKFIRCVHKINKIMIEQ